MSDGDIDESEIKRRSIDSGDYFMGENEEYTNDDVRGFGGNSSMETEEKSFNGDELYGGRSFSEDFDDGVTVYPGSLVHSTNRLSKNAIANDEVSTQKVSLQTPSPANVSNTSLVHANNSSNAHSSGIVMKF